MNALAHGSLHLPGPGLPSQEGPGVIRASDARIGVMILNHNGSVWLPPLYRSLRAGGISGMRVYLVDNGSTDDSLDLTRAGYPEVTVLSLPENLGYCKAYNQAMPQAFRDGCDWVVWANNDTVVEPGCLAELAQAAGTDPRIGILGPCFLGWQDDEPSPYMVGNHPQAIRAMQAGSRIPLDVEWVEGSFLMVRRRCVEDVGPLDPVLFFSWEEADFCRRARAHGWRVVLVPGALARHYGGGTSAEAQVGRAALARLSARNQYIYYLSNPERSFGRNVLKTCHLFLVTMKAHLLAAPRSVLGELSLAVEVLSMTPTIYSKWRRDRRVRQPA